MLWVNRSLWACGAGPSLAASPLPPGFPPGVWGGGVLRSEVGELGPHDSGLQDGGRVGGLWAVGVVCLEERVCPRVGMALQGEVPEETRLCAGVSGLDHHGGEGRRMEWELGVGGDREGGLPTCPSISAPE